MEPHFANQWRKVGIYEYVKLPTFNFVSDNNALAIFFAYWNVGSKSFLLPLGPMSITVLDVSLVLGLFPSSVEISAIMGKLALANKIDSW